MSSAGLSKAAIFGGQPLFASPKPVGQLAAPDIEAFLPHLKPALESALAGESRYALALETALKEYHRTGHCITFTNAGVAIVALLRLLAEEKPGEVIMPAFSYRGLPHFARWAGLYPRFCDVAGKTHGLDPQFVRSLANERTRAILAVNNFNGPCDIDALVSVAHEIGVPILFDSVYGIGSTYRGRPLGSFGAAEVFSLHATKLLNGFEGGYVTTDDAAFASRIRAYGHGQIAATLNEVHAAMGSLSLAAVDEVIARNEARYRAYEKICEDLPGLRMIRYLDERSERHNYEMAVVEVLEPWPLTRDEMVRVLRAENVLITSYYDPPLHRSAHAPKGEQASLPASEDLARRFVQLPVGELTWLEDIERIGELLRAIRANGESIASRLRSRS